MPTPTHIPAARTAARARLAEVDRVAEEYFADPDGLEPVGPDALLERARLAEVTVLDVRPADEYEAGHVPGVRSVPLPELERRLEEIPRDREVVAYCRGPNRLALLAVDRPESRGSRPLCQPPNGDARYGEADSRGRT